MKSFLFAVVLFVTAGASATILPPNNLDQFDSIDAESNITEEMFNKIIDTTVDMWKPLAKLHDAELKANKMWTNNTVNASAGKIQKSWVVNMYGGLARRSEMTPDGFNLALCHELGHLFGGYAFHAGGKAMANEGQSDYFATQACARKIWANTKEENAKFKDLVDNYDKKRCDDQLSTDNDRFICYRSAVASHSLANLLAAVGSSTVPKSDTPDKATVATTSSSHPKAQCRLDTYLAGSFCDVEFDHNLIPGFTEGKNTEVAEKEAFKYSCTHKKNEVASRPFCWFKPLTE